jgi:hypothetical protein
MQTHTARQENGMSTLSGSYPLIAGEKDGQPIPTARLLSTTARITDHTITTFDPQQEFAKWFGAWGR